MRVMFFFASRRRHTRCLSDWSSDVCSSDLGTGLVAEGTGILLNNELDDFAAKPGAPNAFGLVGGTANAPGPGKKPLSSMAPTIVMKNGKLFLVTGSPGGSRIITTLVNVLVNLIDFRMTLAEA